MEETKGDLPEDTDEDYDGPLLLLSFSKYDVVAPLMGILFSAIFCFTFRDPIFELFRGEFAWYSIFPMIPLLGLFLSIIGSIYCYIRWKKFGESQFKVTGGDLKIGSVFKGQLVTSSEVRPTGDYNFILECTEKTETGSGKSKKVKSKTLWKESKTVRPQAYRSKIGIPVEFNVPKESKCSDDNSDIITYKWQLTAKAPSTGINYKSYFDVPFSRKIN